MDQKTIWWVSDYYQYYQYNVSFQTLEQQLYWRFSCFIVSGKYNKKKESQAVARYGLVAGDFVAYRTLKDQNLDTSNLSAVG